MIKDVPYVYFRYQWKDSTGKVKYARDYLGTVEDGQFVPKITTFVCVPPKLSGQRNAGPRSRERKWRYRLFLKKRPLKTRWKKSRILKSRRRLWAVFVKILQKNWLGVFLSLKNLSRGFAPTLRYPMIFF